MSLTVREKEILALLLEGKSNSEIADKLGISLQAVKNRLTEIYQELGVANSRQLFPRVDELKQFLLQQD